MRMKEIEHVLRTIGPFYRMILDSDSAYSWGPVLDDGPVAVCSFQTGVQDGHDLVVRVRTYPVDETAPLLGQRANRWTRVYIDGAFIRDAELSQTNSGWATVITDAQRRGVRIEGEGMAPAELRLALTSGDRVVHSEVPRAGSPTADGGGSTSSERCLRF